MFYFIGYFGGFVFIVSGSIIALNSNLELSIGLGILAFLSMIWAELTLKTGSKE